jgi:DNA-binding NtrC family response regulator
MTTLKTALVIDDDADIRELLTAMLEEAGFAVSTLSDGIDAVELTKWYDVILLDMKMPVFDGQLLTAYWHLTKPDLLQRVIVLSGYSRLSADDGPTFARLEKPFDYADLLKVVHDCIAQQESAAATRGGPPPVETAP